MTNRTARSIRVAVAAALLSVLAAAAPCWAGGGQHYPNGAEDFVVGALPPPGLYLKNYMLYAGKDELRDNDGDKVGVDFDANVFAVIPRIIWVSKYKILGGSWAMHAFFPLYKADVSVDAPDGTELVDSDASGLGDIIFSPFVLGWHFGPSFHMVFALDMFAPTGNYDKKEPASQILSRNNWTFEPVLAMTYLAGPMDFSIKLMYDFNTTNDEYLNPATGETVDLEPGQEFHFDWAVGYAFLNSFRAGATGFFYWQTTDDKLDGDTVDDNRSALAGIGPALKWWPDKGRFSATAKYLWEYNGKNIPQGGSGWLNIIWAF